MTKRIVAILMSTMMLVSFMPAMAFADGELITDNGLIYTRTSDTLILKGVTEKFDGHLHGEESLFKGGKKFPVQIDGPIAWNDECKVTKLYIPSSGLDICAYDLKNAKTVKSFAIDEVAGEEEEVYRVIDGNLYDLFWGGETDYDMTLNMVAPAYAGSSIFSLPDDCYEIAENAFDYSSANEIITKLIINNDSFYIDLMDYEDNECLYDRLAKKQNGTYNLTIRIPVPTYSDGVASFVDYVHYCQKNGKAGIKLEAPLEGCRVLDTTYAKRNKHRKVMFGDAILIEGEDYEFGDCSTVGNKLSADSYCVLITGENHFFLGSDEEPWQDFSVVSEYWITPEKVKKIKYTAGKKKITFKWKADKTKYGSSKYITGYEISYKETTKDNPKHKKVKGYKKTGVTVDGLKKGKYYDVQVRSYKKLSDGLYVYSPWSEEKVVKVK